MKHIKDWIEERVYGKCPENEKYAVAFFFIKGMDAVSSFAVAPIMDQHKLFCMYEDERYRVTGCSTMGDVWINSNMNTDSGYTNRVSVEDCSEWSDV